MHFIIGLGNPGDTYEKTRHNLGFLFLDFLAHASEASWSTNKKIKALTAEVLLGETRVLLVKPQIFMNCSGETVASLLQFYKANTEDILIVHDDLDISSGDYRFVKARGAAGHNGVQNIIDLLKTNDFSRLRLGIGRPARNASPSDTGGPAETVGMRMPPHDYVLATMSEPEELYLQELFSALVPELEKMILKSRS